MKTYLFDTINRYKRFSEKLDVQTAICNKSWWVFNDSGEKELYIFNEDGTLDVSFGGRVTEGKWRYVSANKSIIVSANSESFMLDPAFVDNAIFALKLNGTDQYVFMIDENNTTSFAPTTYKELMGYFDEKLNRAIAIEEAKVREERRRVEEERKQREQEKIRLEEQKLDLYYQQKWIRAKLPREVYNRFKITFYGSILISVLSLVLFFVFFNILGGISFILFICFIFFLTFAATNEIEEKCYNFLINQKDDEFKKEWEDRWIENLYRNFDLYKQNVDLAEIKKEGLK